VRIARQSVNAAVVLAGRLSDPALAASAKVAYVHAMDLVLACCAAVALVAAFLLATLMPAWGAAPQPSEASDHEPAPVT
jgi:hypothetical protein